MLLKSNLRLLLAQLDGLSETPYFSAELDEYLDQLRSVLKALLAKLDEKPITIDFGLATFVGNHVWQLTQFLTGSTTKQIPYEVVYAIERAASEWTNKKLLITTAIIQEANFYFHGANRDFFKSVETELGVSLSSRPVQIALPYIYRHKPLFCIPLYHELGHFVDAANEVIATSMLISPEDAGPDLRDLPTANEMSKLEEAKRQFFKQVTHSHRQEYFADLFCAAYVGQAARGFLEAFCPRQNVSESHPSSEARYGVIEDFLNDRTNPVIELFQSCLEQRGLPRLVKRFSSINIDDAFGNVHPYDLHSDEDVYGLFHAGWQYLQRAWAHPIGNWAYLNEEEIERVSNDLTEKSIRNRMIVESWNASAITS